MAVLVKLFAQKEVFFFFSLICEIVSQIDWLALTKQEGLLSHFSLKHSTTCTLAYTVLPIISFYISFHNVWSFHLLELLIGVTPDFLMRLLELLLLCLQLHPQIHPVFENFVEKLGKTIDWYVIVL